MSMNPPTRVAVRSSLIDAIVFDLDGTLYDNRPRTLRILHRELRGRFACPAPRIAVLGLNPHAGEHGLMVQKMLDGLYAAADKSAEVRIE